MFLKSPNRPSLRGHPLRDTAPSAPAVDWAPRARRTAHGARHTAHGAHAPRFRFLARCRVRTISDTP